MDSQPVTLEPSPAPSLTELRSLLAEARKTADMLTVFQSAISSGTFSGSVVMAVAQGSAFLSAILAQNKVHVENLQKRVNEHGN